MSTPRCLVCGAGPGVVCGHGDRFRVVPTPGVRAPANRPRSSDSCPTCTWPRGPQPARTPYLPQRDNAEDPGQACGATSVAMVAGWRGHELVHGGVQLEDLLSAELRSPEADAALGHLPRSAPRRAWAESREWLLRRHGVESTWSTETPWETVRDALREGRPVIASTTLTRAGHVIVLHGYSQSDDMISIHDPWGCPMQASGRWFYGAGRDRDGSDIHLPRAAVWGFLKGGERGKWCHVVTGVVD